MSEATPPTSGWRRLKLIVKVVELRLRFVAVLVVTGLAIGYWDTIKNHWDKWTRPPNATVSDVAQDSEFYCPMHPKVVRPGLEPNGEIPKCPICGMPLSLRKKGAVPPLPPNVTGRVQLSPDRIRLGGIKTEEVSYRPLSMSITAVGNVVYDESRLSRIVARVSGYIEKLYVSETFTTVAEGEPLAEVYSPELYTAVRELTIASRSTSSPELVGGAWEKLALLGIGKQEIDEILEAKEPSARLMIRARRRGHVIHRAVVEGAHVNTGDTLFEIADLTRVWIEADVYEKDIPFLVEQQAISARVEAFPNRVFAGKVSLVHPHLQAESRTNQVRFVLDNPRHELRPGMFASVRVELPVASIEPFRSIAPVHSATGPLAYFGCPAHADVLSQGTGPCPKCGSDLERHELRDRELIWWCPMHPEVTAHEPGAKCEACEGMKLVPKIVPVPVEGAVLAVPERAVVDTGTKKIVYLEREPGIFEGVLVEVGPRTGDFYPVVKGLSAGDRVASTGAFLIDAETRLNPAAGSTYLGASGGPESNRPSAQGASARDHKLSGESDVRFQGKCPVSGKKLGSMGDPVKILLNGEPVFLCCGGCEEEAMADSAKTLARVRELKAANTGVEKSR